MKGSKAKLKSERRNLRSLHKESIDEETGEAALPAPAELARGEEFQEEEEIQAYNQAREEFRLSAKKVKEVESQLAKLGIENPAELLPGQLESMLKDAQRELSKETRTFLLEHPGVDTETEARLREELVSEKSAEMLARFPNLSDVQKSFVNSYDRYSKSRNSNGDPSYYVLAKALDDSGETLVKSADKAKLFQALQQSRENPTEPLDDIDTEAFTQALVVKILNPYDRYEGDERITRIANDERLMSRPRDTKREDVELLPAIYELPEKEQDAARAERLAFVIKQAKERGTLKGKVSGMLWDGLRGIQRLDTYEARKKEITARMEEIRARLGSGRESIYEDSRSAEQQERQLASEESRTEETYKKLRELPAQLLRASQLPEATLNIPITVRFSDGWGQSYGISGEGLYHEREIQEFSQQRNTEQKSFEELSRSVATVAGMKNGLLGPSREKKDRLQQIRSTFQTSFGKEVESIDDMQSALKSIELGIASKTSDIEQMEREDSRLRTQLKPIEETLRVLDKREFSGTLQDLVRSLSEEVRTAIPEQETRLTEVRGQQREIKDKLRDLNQERMGLESERRGMEYESERIRDDGGKLRNEMEREGFVERETRRY